MQGGKAPGHHSEGLGLIACSNKPLQREVCAWVGRAGSEINYTLCAGTPAQMDTEPREDRAPTVPK